MRTSSVRRVLTIAKQDWRVLRADPVFFVTFTVMPLLLIGFLKPAFRHSLETRVSGANGAEQAVPGTTVLFALFFVSTVGYGVFREYGWGTWDRLRATPARPPEIVVGKAIVPLAQVLVQSAVLLGVGGAVFGLDVSGSVVAVAAVAVAFCVFVVSFGLALLSVCGSVLQLNAIANISALLLAGLGGAIAPLDVLPGWAIDVAPALPTYWAMRGFRAAILSNGGLGDVGGSVAILAAFSAAMIAVASARLRLSQSRMSYA